MVFFMVDVEYVEIDSRSDQMEYVESPDQNRATVMFFMVDVEYVETLFEKARESCVVSPWRPSQTEAGRIP